MSQEQEGLRLDVTVGRANGVRDDGGMVADELDNFILLGLASSADCAGMAHADIRRLSDLAGCSMTAIQKTLRRLAAAGLVEPRGDMVRVDLLAANRLAG